jgi:hypothetical protein
VKLHFPEFLMSMTFLRSASATPVRPPLFELSPVERTHAWWAYLWPFQSRQDRAVMLSVLALGLLLCSVAVWLWVAPQALPYTLTGGLIGGLWLGPWRSLPAHMTITTRSEACQHLADVQKLLMKLGFVLSTRVTEPGHYHYVHPCPHVLLLPLHVAGLAFDLHVRDHTIHLRSQTRWIEWLHKRLTRQLEA